DFGKMKTNSNFKNTFYIRDEQGKAKSQNCWLHSLENKCRICEARTPTFIGRERRYVRTGI
ncbi:hypothetical protein ACTGUT_11095, partial [Streptococcus suis]